MIDRRTLIAGAGAAMAIGPAARAQVFPPQGYATPSGTSPFAPDVYRERRRRVMAELKTGIAIVYGAEQVATDAPVSAPFQQEPNFAWLTGIVDEPGAVLLLAPAERFVQEMLLLPSRNPEAERWNIERVPLGSEIERRTGIQRVLRTSSLGGLASQLALRHKDLRFLGPVVSPDAAVPPVLELYGQLSQRIPGVKIVDDTALMPRMRIVKEAREIELIRRAIAATRQGHLEAMRQVRPGWSERRLKEVLEAGFRAGGGEGLAYESIVGAGRNAASLHYTGGDGAIRPGALILIDAGAAVGGYACDVTRTFPVDGRFTAAQRAQYELVLAAQAAAEAKLRAGVYYEEVSEAAKAVFRQAGRIDDFYHGVGHLVGLRVHDAGDTSQPLPAGAVITIEPGLYVQSEGYGIRVEDDYLITARGAERMTTGIPRTVAEIEAFMAEGRG